MPQHACLNPGALAKGQVHTLPLWSQPSARMSSEGAKTCLLQGRNECSGLLHKGVSNQP